MAGEDLGWIHGTCANGHPLGPGTMSLSWVNCSCRPGQDGHHTVFCRHVGCRAGPRLPPGCPGPRPQR